MTALPGPIRTYLEEAVRSVWSMREEPAPVDQLPTALPEGKVRHIVGGGPFGWLMDARLDEIDGRLALEVLEDSRMSGPNHYRVWEDGTIETLPNEHNDFEHNRRVQELLRERGFLRDA